ncbi:MAG: hypothetical protein OM95_04865 [Bdellovibrio sp. ArHS]|uniref:hypothetical protein n=1 Tax=Bdellovibrio sp. ArHS TaxID=1569284 RepID=UPI000583394F|nr:hypothetical protein [Bdellovibrio sp. ArHS]KHD89158.1 MAG: hypothetical protein OM95_04865 [Bdellovibrio sp. ArHS]
MGFTDKKLETAIIGVSIVLVGALGYVLRAPVQSAIAELEVVYEMPRPKTSFLAALFDLGDREISRKYVNPFAKKKEDPKKTADNKAAAVPVKPVAQKKAEDKKKAENPAPKKVEVQIVGDDTKTGFGQDDFMNPGSGPGQQFVDNSGNSNPKADDTDAKKETLSGSQWQALLRAQPTAENVAKLVDAYNRKDVDDTTFYSIVADLFRSNKAETQALGLMAVKSIYNARSFAITAKYFDQMTPELKTQADAYLAGYAVTARLGILKSALQANDSDVVSAALQVVIEGYQKAKDGVVPNTDPRNSRGDVATNAVAGYSQFIPLLQQLTQSQDAAIANLAASGLGQLQTAVAAL